MFKLTNVKSKMGLTRVNRIELVSPLVQVTLYNAQATYSTFACEWNPLLKALAIIDTKRCP